MSNLPPRTEPDGSGESDATDVLKELRRLLVAPEQADIAALRRRLDDPMIHASDISRVLVEAVALRTQQDDHLAAALRPTVEHALHASVREEPGVLASALFPLMGPAIRRAIAAALRSMIQSIDQVLEHSLSIRGVRWRLEALRTGRPFAEIVLRHSLVYRVEQVFLIHRETGLPLQHRVAPDVMPQDSGMVAGMLTAIQDFVRDSFDSPASDMLERLEVGGLTLWIAQGPRAALAAVVRGEPQPSFRTTLEETLEGIHREWGAELERFRGDTAPFEATTDRLDACLEAQFVTRRAPRRSRRVLAAAMIVVLLALGIWATLGIRDGRRWAAYLDALRSEPGIVVTAAGSRAGTYFVTGLRDPFAADPASMLAAAQLSPDAVVERWEPYHALVPDFILARARAVLEPPPTVELALRDHVLLAIGSAPREWIDESRRLARALPGVEGFNDDQLDNADIASLANEIEARVIVFPPGTAEPRSDQRNAIAVLSADVRRLEELAADAGRNVRIEVVGRADEDGSAETVNLRLSRLRAERIARLLGLDGRGAALEWSVRGAGTAEPLRAGNAIEDASINRSVSLRIMLDATVPAAEVLR